MDDADSCDEGVDNEEGEWWGNTAEGEENVGCCLCL